MVVGGGGDLYLECSSRKPGVHFRHKNKRRNETKQNKTQLGERAEFCDRYLLKYV